VNDPLLRELEISVIDREQSSFRLLGPGRRRTRPPGISHNRDKEFVPIF
jgi:hypothetical protein